MRPFEIRLADNNDGYVTASVRLPFRNCSAAHAGDDYPFPALPLGPHISEYGKAICPGERNTPIWGKRRERNA